MYIICLLLSSELESAVCETQFIQKSKFGKNKLTYLELILVFFLILLLFAPLIKTFLNVGQVGILLNL